MSSNQCGYTDPIFGRCIADKHDFGNHTYATPFNDLNKLTVKAAGEPVIPGGAKRVSIGRDYSQLSHIAIGLMAETQAEGNHTYGVGNWQNGLPLSNLLSHAIKHLLALQNGDTSEETIRQHFGHALWNIEKAAHFYYTRPDLVDIQPLRKAMEQHGDK